jgi:hypothetical protein
MYGHYIRIVNGEYIAERLRHVGKAAEYRGSFGKGLVVAITGSL